MSFLQSKRKLDPRKGRSQSSGEDVVWFSLSVSSAACSYLFHKGYIFVLPCCSCPLSFVYVVPPSFPSLGGGSSTCGW